MKSIMIVGLSVLILILLAIDSGTNYGRFIFTVIATFVEIIVLLLILQPVLTILAKVLVPKT